MLWPANGIVISVKYRSSITLNNIGIIFLDDIMRIHKIDFLIDFFKFAVSKIMLVEINVPSLVYRRTIHG